jgi:hypothetical protein
MLSGQVRDSFGGVMPGVAVTLIDTASGAILATTTDPSGMFGFRNLPPASYQFRASLPGFTTLTTVVTLASGENVQRSFEMRVGQLVETVTVTCGSGAAMPRAHAEVLAFDRSRLRAAAARLFDGSRQPRPLAQQGVPVRIGGNIAAPRQIKRVQPACPATALQGTGLVVILEGTIGVDGLITEVRALRPKPGEAQQEYAQSAMDAVRQWEYTPTRLNNVPIAVIATITVVYQRQ